MPIDFHSIWWLEYWILLCHPYHRILIQYFFVSVHIHLIVSLIRGDIFPKFLSLICFFVQVTTRKFITGSTRPISSLCQHVHFCFSIVSLPSVGHIEIILSTEHSIQNQSDLLILFFRKENCGSVIASKLKQVLEESNIQFEGNFIFERYFCSLRFKKPCVEFIIQL